LLSYGQREGQPDFQDPDLTISPPEISQ